MERSFDDCKRMLERECVVEEGLFAESLVRLREFMLPFVASFSRRLQREHAETFVGGLCSDLAHKNAESIAYHFGLERKAMQHFVGESAWDDEPVRQELARQIADQLGTEDGVLVFDPSGYPKSGRESVGVARQWCGRLGKVDNCQVGIYLGYVSAQGHALVDAELFLPEEWTQDRVRLKKAGVPKSRWKHRTRHAICLELLKRHGKQLPHGWITGDDELGRPSEFRRKLRDLKEQYLFAVPCNTLFRDLEIPPPDIQGRGRPRKRPTVRADRWTAEQPASAWQRVDVRDAEKGPLIVEVLARRVQTSRKTRAGAAEETFVAIRYRDRDQAIVKQDYYLSNAASTTPLAEFARVAKAEHRIEECFDRGKGEAGLADYEVRNWVGWHHHQTLSLLASWFLNVETRRAEKKDASHHLQSSPPVHRLNHPRPLQMRFTPRRQTPHNATTPA
jgi:SRSO17 transposase